MSKMLIIYGPIASITAKTLMKVAEEEFNIETCDLITAESWDTWGMGGPERAKLKKEYQYILKYGIRDETNPFSLMTKPEQAREVTNAGILPNTLYSKEEIKELPFYKNIIQKNPTRIIIKRNMTPKTAVYRYIPNKSEWRINCAFNKVNNVLRKDLMGYPLGNAAPLHPETDPKTREELIKFAKDIMALVELQNFGLDIIRDESDGKYYFLELNQANQLTESTAYYFLRTYFEQYR
jgi:hypothetical protein